jgi:beta-N-acetylhexosaminidase
VGVSAFKNRIYLITAMGRFGELYQQQPEQAIQLAEQCGWLMATEVLAVVLILALPRFGYQ